MVKHVIDKIPIYRSVTLKRPSQALRSVSSKEKMGVYASSDTLFRGAIFGRDSLEVAEDLIRVKRKLVKEILLALASLQGEKDNKITEEEPGKIVHEYRRTVVDGKPIDAESLKIFKQLSRYWGGTDEALIYYGSADATPHFLRVLGGYCELYGHEILTESVQLRSGITLSMAKVMENAVEWLVFQLEKSKSGLLEYHRRNPDGLQNQVWKDSNEFYIHEGGKLANHDSPISSIEIQALAYDALKHAAQIFEHRNKELGEKADKLRDRTIKLLWQPDWEYFALGTDFDSTGKLRLIKTVTANPAEMLESGFFDGLPDKDKKKYISGIVRMIMSDEFLTDAGIRSRGLSEARLIKFF